MNILDNFTPQPSEFKSKLKDYGIPVAGLARYLDLNYTYVTNLLNGVARMTPEVATKIQNLFDQLESEESDGRLGES